MDDLNDPESRKGASDVRLGDCWAKTDEARQPALSVRDHCIHVGMVATEVCERLVASLRPLVPDGAVPLIAAHDIGKITPGFLMKSPAWRETWQSALGLDSPDIYEGNHTRTGQRFLAEAAAPATNWLISVGGHHGRYTSSSARARAVFEGEHAWVSRLRLELLTEICALFGALPSAAVEKSARLHWFTGLMVFCDWIGSNTGWFPITGTGLRTVADDARERSRVALDDIGWGRHEVSPGRSFSQMFPSISSQPLQMRPLQEALVNAADVRGLYIVEAPMGEGKTEAALAAAFRRWSEGEERGLYFALPTQLTSNRIHARVGEFLKHVLASDSSLSLAHGNAWISGRRITPVLPAAAGEDGGANLSNLWFSDSRRALLAPFGVGTMDQALMAVMPVKHSALRLFGLGGKVIVIDEVHSYDPYTAALLDRTVEWFLKVGCTVIVLSATLTKARRSQLLAAAGAVGATASDAYPLLTKVASGDTRAQTIPVPDGGQMTKSVRILHRKNDSAEWIQEAATAAESGACVLVVRNTIAAAQLCFDQLKAACRDLGLDFGLLHSRFPQFRRDQNEEHWMRLLGKDGSHRPARGCILVGTQVLEQSVDIDADLLITDLAPTDLLFQRMGRLHRHDRPRPQGFEQPAVIVLQPSVDWNGEAADIKEALGSSAFVYPPFALYQAQRVWASLSQVMLPSDLRPLLEESSRIPGDLPPGAETLRLELERKVSEMLGTAWMNTVFGATTIDDIEGMQTRWRPKPSGYVILLGSPPARTAAGITLHFLDGSSSAFVPGHFDFGLALALHRNACRVPRYLIKDALQSAPDWLAQHFPDSILAVCPSGSAECLPCDSPAKTAYNLSYHTERGLSHERNPSVPATWEEDESWF